MNLSLRGAVRRSNLQPTTEGIASLLTVARNDTKEVACEVSLPRFGLRRNPRILRIGVLLAQHLALDFFDEEGQVGMGEA